MSNQQNQQGAKAVSNKAAAGRTTNSVSSRTRSLVRVANRAVAVNRAVNNPTARFQILLLLWPRQRGFFLTTEKIREARQASSALGE
jgi:hypothetical protein